MTGEVRRCKHCGEVKPLTLEHFEPQTATSLRHKCRECRKLGGRAYAAAKRAALSPEERREASRTNYLKVKKNRRWRAAAGVPLKVQANHLSRADLFGDLAPGVQGIYAIKSKISSRLYVGSSRDIRARWHGHVSELRHGRHHAPRLQNAWRRHGEEAFSFEVLEIVLDSADLVACEQKWIDALGAHTSKGGYNCSAMAGRPVGFEISPEYRRKISEANRKKARPYLITFPDGYTEYVPNIADWAAERGERAAKYREAARRQPAQLYKGLWVRLAEANFEAGPPPDWRELPGVQERARLGGAAAAQKTSKTYKVTHPDGTVEIVTSINEFGERHGVNPHGLRRVARSRTLHTCQGFRVEYA